MSEERNERPRIYSHMTRSSFLHIEDALAIGKVRLFVGKYKRGQGASSTAFHFLDVDDARVLLSDLSWGKTVDFADFKGTANGDGPQSRVLKVKTNEDKVWLEIQNGPGEVVGQGAIKPKGKPDASVSVPFTIEEARKLAYAVLAYVQAWEVAQMIFGGKQAQTSSSPPNPQPRRDDTEQTEEAAGAERETTSKRPATSTAFWTLFNTEGRRAGLTKADVEAHLQIELGNPSTDWRTAIDVLESLIEKRQTP
jgi:hypothetical protein